MKMRAIRILSLAVALCGYIGMSAQTVYKDWVDGQVHIIVKQEVPMNIPVDVIDGKAVISYDPTDLGTDYFDWLKPVLDKYQVTKFWKPAHAAKTSNVLQRTYRIEFSDIHNVENLINDLKKVEQIELVEKSPMCYTSYTPNDPLHNSSTMWGLFRVRADSAWDVWKGGATKAIVATVDNAIDYTHTDLTGAMWVNTVEQSGTPGVDDDGNGYVDDIVGWDAGGASGTPDNDPMPPSNSFDHGTHVTGTIGAKTDNNNGISSIGFNGVQCMAVKATRDNAGSSSVTNGYDGIIYAAVNGAHIISCSWGGTGYSSYGQNVVNYATNQGSIVVAAAGNSNTNTLHYPGAYTNVLCVGATNGADQKASFSNYGSWVDVSAPGTSIYSTLPDVSATPSTKYGYKQGTSMATPMVSGLLGYLYSYNPSLSDSALINCVLNNCDPVQGSFSSQMGAGRINAKKALQCVGASLNNPPLADFYSNIQTVTAGGTVNFFDNSSFGPTSWSWTFSGGTPSSSSVQNPQNIKYNTPGIYNVSLTATNANGNNTKTKNGYIVVTASTGCDTLTNIIWPTDSGKYSTIGSGTAGYFGGMFGTTSTQWAEKYDATSFSTATHVQSVRMSFANVGAASPASSFAVAMWSVNGTTGAPDTVLAAIGVSLSALDAIIPPGYFSYITLNFASPVKIPTNRKFFVGVSVPKYGTGDTLSQLYVNNSGSTTRTNTVWTTAGGASPGTSWAEVGTRFAIGGKTANLNGWKFVNITKYPVTAALTPDSVTICEGDSVNFSGNSSTGAASYSWSFNGGTISSSTSATPSVTFTKSGTYMNQQLKAYNQCGFYDYEYADVYVLPTPSVSIATTADTVCNGQSATLTASGATTYNWTPGGAVNPLNTGSLTNTTSYTVTGTGSNGCSDVQNYTIYVENTPNAAFNYSPTTVCPGMQVTFNGTLSSDANSYSWNLSGATPSTSTAPTPTVTYSGVGTYPVFLTASNSCANDTLTGWITITACTGLNSVVSYDKGVKSVFDGNNNLDVLINDIKMGTYSVQVTNTMGQIVISDEIRVNEKLVKKTYSLGGLASGAYFVTVVNNEMKYSDKFVKY